MLQSIWPESAPGNENNRELIVAAKLRWRLDGAALRGVALDSPPAANGYDDRPERLGDAHRFVAVGRADC